MATQYLQAPHLPLQSLPSPKKSAPNFSQTQTTSMLINILQEQLPSVAGSIGHHSRRQGTLPKEVWTLGLPVNAIVSPDLHTVREMGAPPNIIILAMPTEECTIIADPLEANPRYNSSSAEPTSKPSQSSKPVVPTLSSTEKRNKHSSSRLPNKRPTITPRAQLQLKLRSFQNHTTAYQ